VRRSGEISERRRKRGKLAGLPSLVPLFALVLGLAGAARAAAAALDAVRIGIVRSPAAAVMLIAAEQGYFRDAGLEARIEFLPSEASIAEAVATRKLDIGAATLTGSFFKYAYRHGLKLIAPETADHTGFPVDALLISRTARDAGFRGVRDLPGRRIAGLQPDSASRYGLAKIGERFHVDLRDTRMVWSGTAARALEALHGGMVDAVILPYRDATRAANKGEALLRLSDFAVWEETAVFTSGDTIRTQHRLLERFMEAYQRGTAEYAANFLESDDGGDQIPGPRYSRYMELLARETHIEPAMLAADRRYVDRRGRLDAEELARQVKFWQQEGWLPRGATASDLMDVSFSDGASSPTPASGAPSRH